MARYVTVLLFKHCNTWVFLLLFYLEVFIRFTLPSPPSPVKSFLKLESTSAAFPNFPCWIHIRWHDRLINLPFVYADGPICLLKIWMLFFHFDLCPSLSAEPHSPQRRATHYLYSSSSWGPSRRGKLSRKLQINPAVVNGSRTLLNLSHIMYLDYSTHTS